ncbi:MAG: hypothetical protein R6V06_01685 [Kiritimatiellia bacterium]
MKVRNIVTLSFVLIGFCSFAGTNGTWTNTVGGLWSDTNNWENGIVPFGRGHMATFNTADVSVTNDAAIPVGVLRYTQNGGGKSVWRPYGAGRQYSESFYQ